MSPEALGLIQWRETPPSVADPESAESNHESTAMPAPQPNGNGASAQEQQLVLDWILRSATAVASVVMKALADYPVKTAVPNATATPGSTSGPSSEPPEEDPPPEAAGVG